MITVYIEAGQLARVACPPNGNAAPRVLVIEDGEPVRLTEGVREDPPEGAALIAARRTEAAKIGIACEVIAEKFIALSKNESQCLTRMRSELKSTLSELIELLSAIDVGD